METTRWLWGRGRTKSDISWIFHLCLFVLRQGVTQTGLQFAMQMTLIFLPPDPLRWDYQCLLPCLICAVLEIWPRPSCVLSKCSTAKLDPSLISPISIFVVDVGTSLAIYKNIVSSKLFLPNTRSILWKVRFKLKPYFRTVFCLFLLVHVVLVENRSISWNNVK